MCGIAGFYNNDKTLNFSDAIIISRKMSETLNHRGPDYQNTWHNNSNLFFAHSRLSILDLSEKGHQPMISHSKRYVITYNGEIYNHKSIRLKIENEKKIHWKSECDTETLIESIEAFGLEKTLNLIDGMFAFALWDCIKQTLYLARDKHGEKPLYYGFANNSLVFGSSISAINCYPNLKKKISNEAIKLYLKFSYIPEPYSIFNNVYKVNPSEFIMIRFSDLKSKNDDIKNYLKKDYWYKKDHIKKIDPKIDQRKYTDDLDKLLTNSVTNTLISDVPIGCFLSGGIDSSLISSIAQKVSKNKIQTFSIGFQDKEFDELKYSRIVSKHIGSDHNELVIDNEKIFSVFENIHNIYDEPFSDSSQIPSVILAEFVKKKVKVALTGDGADELFGGYNRYVYTKELWKVIKFIPFNFRKIIGNLVSKISIKNIFLLTKIFKLLKLNFPQMKDKIEKISNILIVCKSEIDMYFLLTQIYNDVNRSIYLNTSNKKNNYSTEINKILNNQNFNNQEKMMLIDQNTYLSGDILHKVDRASMNFGLETRLPFLDSKIYEFSKNLPLKNKINGTNGKWILKEISKKYLPMEIIKRKKMGFSIPLRKWIGQNILKIENNFIKNSDRFIDINIDPNMILKYLKEHRNGSKDWSNYIWSLVVLDKWMDKNFN